MVNLVNKVQKVRGLSWQLSSKESTCNAGDVGLIPGPEDPRRRKWQPTPVFLLANPMVRGAWCATVHGVTEELDTTYQVNNNNLKSGCWCGQLLA